MFNRAGKKISATLVLLFAFALSATAWATSFKSKSGSGWTRVSGYTGSGPKKVNASSSSNGLYRLKFYEKWDDANLINVYERKLSTSSGASTGTAGELRIKSGGSSAKTVDVGSGHYITAIQVCTTDKNNSSKNEIKGVRVWGGKLKSGGRVQNNSTAHEFKRNNCKKWRTKVKCSSNEVATGIKAYYQHESFSGISLNCKKLTSS